MLWRLGGKLQYFAAEGVLCKCAVALGHYRARLVSPARLGKACFRYDYSSLWLFSSVWSLKQEGTRLLHVVEFSLLFQRAEHFMDFKKGYSTVAGFAFKWETFGKSYFLKAAHLHCTLGFLETIEG